MTIGRASDFFRKKAAEWRAKQKLFGTDFYGWWGNGAQELQSVFVPTATQVQLGTNPVYGVTTTGQVTAERLGDSHPKGKDVHGKEGDGREGDGKGGKDEKKQPELDME